MFLKKLWICDSLFNEVYSRDFFCRDHSIRRLTILDDPAPEINTLILTMLAVGLGAGHDLSGLAGQTSGAGDNLNSPRFFRALLTLNHENGTKKREFIIQNEIVPSGVVRLSQDRLPGRSTQCNSSKYLEKRISDKGGPFGYFAYGYNSNRNNNRSGHVEMDSNPLPRSSRFGTLFDRDFRLTPVCDWLDLLYRNAIKYNSKKAEVLYNTSVSAVSFILQDVVPFRRDKDNMLYFRMPSGEYPLYRLPEGHIQSIELLIDFVRQLADSRTTTTGIHLNKGILFINQIERLFDLRDNPGRIKRLLQFFPNIQVIATCYDPSVQAYLKHTAENCFSFTSDLDNVSPHIVIKHKRTKAKSIGQNRNNFLKNRFHMTSPAERNTVVLIDVDSAIPNLALMKLSRYYKNRHKKVILARDSSGHYRAKHVFASCIFNRPGTEAKLRKLRSIHGDDILIGGSGVDISLRLSDEIEALMPDYSLYGGMDFALGFLTRGCMRKCEFCIVPIKEGRLKRVAEIDDIVPAGQKRLVLLDDNLLAYPGVNGILKEMKEKGLQVNFNQTLDIKYLTPETAELLQKIDSRNYFFTRRMYYFSLNSPSLIPLVREKIRLLYKLRRSEITFICMYGYNTTLSEDIEIFSFLQSLGVSPFVQEYQPVIGREAPVVKHYFDADIAPLFKIYFRQNGRNFERFLKWVSRRYALETGRLCMPLVDMIFKYNNRQHRHKYIATKAGTVKA